MLMRGPYSIYNIFTNAEFPYPQVTLQNGVKVTLDLSGYSKYRSLSNPNDRELVFKEFWTAISKFQRTLAEQLYSQINTALFRHKTRKYNSCLENALDGFNIPVDVYYSLIKNVNQNLDSFHRYLKLRKRLLGLETLKYSDMYAPIGTDAGMTYDFDQAHKLMVNSMASLGKDYQEILQKANEERWIDIYPNNGKRSGAYCNGSVYDGHPYVLLNYNGLLDDVSTYAHEMGHAMHSYYSNKTQPYPTSRYSIFVAEVASTFNEALLSDYMQQHCEEKNLRLSLLLKALDGFKGTLFRQTQFAEFELFIHQKVEKSEALTSEVLNNAYGELLQKYYGHNSDICHIDELYHVEWAYIPHFYYNFYVYQYATSFVASMALAEQVLNKEEGAKERYLEFLSSGCSDYPIELLKKAGVDMTTDVPFNNAIANMNRIMDEIEEISEQ
jgi:oligoendopeptidase F